MLEDKLRWFSDVPDRRPYVRHRKIVKLDLMHHHFALSIENAISSYVIFKVKECIMLEEKVLSEMNILSISMVLCCGVCSFNVVIVL